MSAQNTYDLVPYRSFPFPQSHPSRLSAVARLFGQHSPSIRTARILEIGCASGGNLLPLAEQYPDSVCLGFDLSTEQILEGQKLAQEGRLQNIELRVADAATLELGQQSFDFIICHGVFSWIPAAARDAVLRICRDHLSSNGLAYISYNAYPGWNDRRVLRDVMRFRTRGLELPGEQLKAAREIVSFFASSINPDLTSYSAMWKAEAEAVARSEDHYLFHEHLEDENQPFYFHEFLELAARHDLQYVAESDIGSMSVDSVPDPIAAVIRSVASSDIELEQYLDFLRNRAFRQTILCRSGQAVRRPLVPAAVAELSVATNAAPESPVKLEGAEQVVYRRGAATLRTNEPVVKAALQILRDQWPQFLPFRELLARARSLAEERAVAVETELLLPAGERLAQVICRCFGTGVLEVRDCPPNCRQEVTEHPKATPLARAQARRGANITNRLHENVAVDDLQRRLLALLDGSSDVPHLVRQIQQALENKSLVLAFPPHAVPDRGTLERTVEAATRQALAGLARMALLVD